MQLKKNTNLGITNFFIILILIIYSPLSNAEEINEVSKDILVEINVLDKVSSKNTILKFNIGEEIKFQNLQIKVLKCENSKFDISKITAYIQVKDLNISDNEKVLFLMVGHFHQVQL